MPVPPKQDPVKTCETCGAAMTRKRFGKRLEDRTRFLARKTCSQACGNTRAEVTKSAHHWRARRAIPLVACGECGTTQELHVHHKDRNPANNTMSNLMVLCASCHLRLHWAEDREKRVAAIKSAAALRGAHTLPQYVDGKPSRGV